MAIDYGIPVAVFPRDGISAINYSFDFFGNRFVIREITYG
jgi:hypothetical protein